MFDDNKNDFDERFPDGVFAIPKGKEAKKVRVRALYGYCKEKGLTPQELSDKEIAMFIEKDKGDR